MAHVFPAPDRHQRFPLPVDMMDRLPEDDIVHLVVDAVGLMDLREFEATCKVGHEQGNRLKFSFIAVEGVARLLMKEQPHVIVFRR